LKRIGPAMQPCRTPFEIGNASERTPSTLTLPSIPLCSDRRIRVISQCNQIFSILSRDHLCSLCQKLLKGRQKRCIGPCFVLCIFLAVDEQQRSCQLFLYSV